MPFIASVCKMPTEAEELWMIAVTTVPVRIASSGFFAKHGKCIGKDRRIPIGLNCVGHKGKTDKQHGKSDQDFTDLFLFLSDFANKMTNAPIPSSRGA